MSYDTERDRDRSAKDFRDRSLHGVIKVLPGGPMNYMGKGKRNDLLSK